MKRILAIILALTMLVGLAACGGAGTTMTMGTMSRVSVVCKCNLRN